MYTAAIMKTELEASKGTRKLDMRIDNVQLVNVFTSVFIMKGSWLLDVLKQRRIR